MAAENLQNRARQRTVKFYLTLKQGGMRYGRVDYSYSNIVQIIFFILDKSFGRSAATLSDVGTLSQITQIYCRLHSAYPE
jgi:hypothetical protein